jgi:hypothetical protein
VSSIPKRTFILKPMVFARLLAEATVLVVLIITPLVLWIPGNVQKLPHTMQLSLFGLSALALIVLPFYGFITYKVQVDPEGLKTVALFSKPFANWQAVEKLSLKTTLNWKRYVVSADNVDLAFPVWLKDLPTLLGIIRSQLPEGTTGGDKERSYRQDAMGQIIRYAQIIGWCLFVIVFWNFYAGAMKTLSAADSALVLVAAILATIIISWRCFVIATLPHTVKTNPEGLLVKTLFGEKVIAWEDCEAVSPSFLLLPEGVTLKTKKGSILITDNLDGADELAGEIKDRVASSQKTA